MVCSNLLLEHYIVVPSILPSRILNSKMTVRQGTTRIRLAVGAFERAAQRVTTEKARISTLFLVGREIDTVGQGMGGVANYLQ